MKFLKLSKMVLNTRFIQKVLIKQDCYKIYLVNLEKSCTILMGSGGFNFEPEIHTIPKESPDSEIIKNYFKEIPIKRVNES
jgi:hypothetical protein